MVANAGVYVKNIVPIIAAHGSIDKDFKLFTKDGKSVGGSVRLLVDFTPDAGQSVDDTQAPTNNDQDEGLRTFHFTEDQAAAKIQAAFKGNKTRKELQSKAAAPSGSSGAGGGNKAVILGAVAAVGIAALSLVGGGRRGTARAERGRAGRIDASNRAGRSFDTKSRAHRTYVRRGGVRTHRNAHCETRACIVTRTVRARWRVARRISDCFYRPARARSPRRGFVYVPSDPVPRASCASSKHARRSTSVSVMTATRCRALIVPAVRGARSSATNA